MRRILFALALAMALNHAAYGADNTTTEPRDSMKIRLKVEDTVITATLIDSKTARDFISLLPLTLTMNDLFRRKKWSPAKTDAHVRSRGRRLLASRP
jgi:hypothetical protein